MGCFRSARTRVTIPSMSPSRDASMIPTRTLGRMKVYAAGELVEPRGPCSPADAMGYVLSLEGVSCVVVGCRTPHEVEENAEVARQFQSFSKSRLHDLEERVRPEETMYTSYKKAP